MTISKTLAVAAATGLFSGVAMAQASMEPANLVRADDISDSAIYRLTVTEGDTMWNSGTAYTQVSADWAEIGETEDILLDQDGKLVAVYAEIGGFLGIGERDVVIPLENVRVLRTGNGSFQYVTNLSEAQLEALPHVDDDIWD